MPGPYRIAGNINRIGKIYLINELTDQLEHTAVISGTGEYEITVVASGTGDYTVVSGVVVSGTTYLATAKTDEDGESLAYGNVLPKYYGDRGIFCGGYRGTDYNIIDYVTISTEGNAQDFGEKTQTEYG